jgi:hypothetical protein
MFVKNVICCIKNVWSDKVFSAILTSLVKIIFPVILLCGFQYIKAQTNQVDTIDIIEKVVEKKDTMVRYKASIPTSPRWSLILEKPIDSVLIQNNSAHFKKGLYNLLFKNGSENQSNQRYPTTNTTLAAMDGKIIRQILFDKVDIFVPSVSDTSFIPSSWFEKTVNNTHIDTRRNILKRYLLLKPGDPLDVFLVAENERILRELSFIMDARFIAVPIEGSSDSVDILLLTQDKLPIGLAAKMVKSTIASLEISHHNMLGFGHQLVATSYWDAKNVPHFGYRLSYGAANLAGTFTSGKIDYIHKWNQESYIIDFSRDFRSTSFRNAGGFIFENTDMRKNIELLDTTLSDVNLKYTNTDLWAGRLLQLKNNSRQMRSGLFVTGRLNQYENHDGPVTSGDYLYPFQDKTLLLFSTGFTRQGFKKDNLIYTFGRTEDVPFGYLFDITSGFEWGQYKTRPYVSVGAAFGNYFRNSGYLYGQVKFGTFMHQGLMEQGALLVQLRYFSNLHNYNRFQYRNFVNLAYLHGINRFTGEYTGVENNGGIVGLTSQSLRGKDKIVLNLESVIFSPFVLLGFRFAFFGSIDLGLVVSENSKITDSRLFSGLSAGVRIRNDQLVFNTFVIKFAVYPGMPEDGTARNFIVDSMNRLRFNDFFPYKPAIVSYQ